MRRASGWLFTLLGLGLLLIWLGVRENPTAGQDRVVVAFLDVGQGDAILVRSPEGKTALIDAGPSRQIVPLLERRGVTSIDLAVVSHHHDDHYGGMDDVVRRFRPRVFLASDSSYTSERYLKLLELVRDRRIPAISPTGSARKLGLGSVVLTVFPRAPADPDEENNNSVGLRLQYGSFSVLLPGDAEGPERRWWEENMPSLCADATVLKLAHHGSRSGTDTTWLKLVRPQLAVASMGRDNEFGHPHPQTLALLRRFEIPLLRTDRDGTIVIQSDGARWSVVDHRHVSPRTTLAPARTRCPDARVHNNQADEGELSATPGFGPVLVRRMIGHRPFQDVDDLGRVEEIGETRLSRLRPLVVAE